MCERPSHEEKAEFRKLLGVLHPGSVAASETASDLAASGDIMPALRVAWSDGPQVRTGLRTPGATPILHVQYEVKEPEPRPGERALSSPEAANEVLFDTAVTQLRMLEPDNPQLSMLKTRDWVSDDAAVACMELELDAATARAKAKSAPITEQVRPSRPKRDEPGGDRDNLLLPSPQPTPCSPSLLTDC